jgi:hypothetical protein
MVDNALEQIGMLFVSFTWVNPIMKEQTCFFHWTQLFNMHIIQLIAPKFHDQHKTFCYKYKNARSLEEIDLCYVVIFFKLQMVVFLQSC